MKRGTENKMLCRIGYNKERDAFELLLSSDGGETWSMSVSSKCRRCADDPEAVAPDFIHISLIVELKQAIAFGYEMVY